MFSLTSGIRLLPPLPHPVVTGVKFSPDGSRFATASDDHGFHIYSTHDGNILFDSGQYGSTGAWARTPLAWSSDGQQLFIAGIGKITCFELANSSSSEWSTHDNQHGVSIASNSRFIACAAGSSVSLWDCVTYKQISPNITHTAQTRCIALSPCGGYLACGNGRNLTIHNLRDVLPPEYFDHGLPLIRVSDETFKSWTQDDATNTERLLSEEITSASIPRHYVLANRALIRARLKHLAPAIEDAKESLQVQPSPIGHISMAVALLGQGDREGALWTFDLAFHDCELHGIKFLLLLKSILVFESGNQEKAIMRVEHLAMRAKNDNDDEAAYLYTQARASYDADFYAYEEGKLWMCNTIDRACEEPSPQGQAVSPTSDDLSRRSSAVTQRLCESLYAEGRTAEAVDTFLNIISTSDQEIQASKAIADWVTDFTKKCTVALEHVDDGTFGSAKYDGTIVQCSAAFPLSPASLFIKRSRGRAASGSWEYALQDANDAVKVDPSIPWGYEAKYKVLHGTKRYDEAVEAFKSMLRVIEQSHDPAIRQLRKNYISPSETTAVIDPIVREILNNCPLVVINVTSGCLCDGSERMRIFKAGPSFKQLLSSTTTEIDKEKILRAVAGFFGYVVFSHVWEGTEPSFQDVNAVKSVWNLPDTPQNEKLRNFCKETQRLGYNWAWSDTCCIDKSTSSILNQSLTSMYKWYADSAATLVFLAGVAHPSKPGDLTHSLWMTRAWTLQELLSPKVIFFYDSEWKPYIGDTGANHKESPEIMQELADAIKIPHGTIVTFSPDDLGVREKLRLASLRNATVEEDVAYSLIGIFKSDIRPHYGERADALGHLLEEIVARSGEVTVLAWSGKPSSYNSCLPASLSVYSQTPYSPPSLEGEEMERCIKQLRDKLPRQEARSIYNKINRLSLARFATRRLHLPCIVFSVRSLEKSCSDDEKLYCAKASGLGQVEFTTADDLSLNSLQKFVFAHPWIDYIRGPSSGVTWGDDSESDTDSDSDEVASSHTVSVPQVDNYTRALEVIVRLGQPFSTLLLVQQSNGTYKRVAAENEIVVSGLGTNIASKHIRAKVLEVL
ncbi:hypothetical protein F5J12DRAFT_911546 [Pisolithus orientalis]|uniref:uncharacterized protein n=1 Tax=Pisolithus orientalis TaxID=936130 RepID=UPI002224A749|nr:uncharacterized protein F5J12DRAFT_911546 [Pisolithus orientalis]KAI6015000.1 hypothetical protein F5J12DRAFT_911546 [Pisolithus orientalis]